MPNYLLSTMQARFINNYQVLYDWVEVTHNNLIGVGLLQTADTGQLVVTPSADTLSTSATTHGFRIYEINDAYSAQVPIYIRVEFRTISATSGTNLFGVLIVSAGFQTNGAGTLLNQTGRMTLKALSSSATSSPTWNPNAKFLTVKHDGLFVHGNFLQAGYQTTTNIYESGLFGILREQQDGVINPDVFTFFYQVAAINRINSSSLKYLRMDRLLGISTEVGGHMFHLPRIPDADGVVLATAADISLSNTVEITDRLIAIRVNDNNKNWSIVRLSVDGLTDKNYLILPMNRQTVNSNPNSFDEAYICANVSDIEIPYGVMGVLIDG